MTQVSLDAVLPSLEAQAARLNAASDRANNVLAALEKRVVDFNIGIEFWHSRPIETGDAEGNVGPEDTKTKIAQVLGLARVDGRWCLAVKPIKVVEGFFQGDTDCPYRDEFAAGPAVAVMKASRAIRLAALQSLPAFLQELQGQVTEAVRRIETTASQLETE